MKKLKSIKIILFTVLALISFGFISNKVFAAEVTGSTTVLVDGTISPDLKVSLNGSAYVVANQADGPLVISYESAFNLSWGNVDGANSCTLDGVDVPTGPWSINKIASGWTNNNHDFILKCTGNGITGLDTVHLSYPPKPTNMKTSCSADGKTATLSWTNVSGYNGQVYTRAYPGQYRENVDRSQYIIYGDDVVGSSFSFPVTPGDDYTAWVHTRADNQAYSDGLFPDSMVVNCPTPKINPDLKVSVNYAGSPTVDNSDGPELISYYAAYTLKWDKVDNATSCILDGFYPISDPSKSGSVEWRAEGWSNNTHDFILKCKDANGNIGTDTVRLSYPPPPTNMKTACSSDGTNVTLSWTNAPGYNDQVYTRVHKGSYQDPYYGQYMIYGDDATGKTLSFAVEPNTNYTAWVHTRADSGAYSIGLFTNDSTMDFQCAPQGETTGTISATDCTIDPGKSSCDTTLKWNTVNPVGVSDVTTPDHITVATANSNTVGKTYSVDYGSRNFFLYNSGKPTELDMATATATCKSGTSWDSQSQTCKSGTVAMTGTITSGDCLIDVGKDTCTIHYNWQVLNPEVVGGTKLDLQFSDPSDFVTLYKEDSGIQGGLYYTYGLYHGQATFVLTNNNKTVASKLVKSECDSAKSIWSDTAQKCVTSTSTCDNGATDYPNCSTCSDGSVPLAGGSCPPADNFTCGTNNGATPILTESTTGPTACTRGAYINSPADTTTNGHQAWNWSCGVGHTCTAPKFGCRVTTDSNYVLPQYGANGPDNNYGCATACLNGSTNYPACSNTIGTCFDGIQNQDETGIDTGGVCGTLATTGKLTISPSTCVIEKDKSTCTTTGATWTSAHTTNIALVDQNTGNILSKLSNNNTPLLVYAAYPQTVFNLKDDSGVLDTQTVTTSCTTGTAWDTTSKTCKTAIDACSNGATNFPECNDNCPAPTTENVTVACDVINNVMAISGSVTRSQVKSAFPGCLFPELPITKDNSKYETDDCKYPPGTCTNRATNYPTCTIGDNNVCLNGASNPPTCSLCLDGNCGGGGSGDGYWSGCSWSACDPVTNTQICTETCILPEADSKSCDGGVNGIWTSQPQTCSDGGGSADGTLLGITFNASSLKIFKGRSSVLTWDSNAESCSAITGNNLGQFSTNNASKNLTPGVTVSPLKTTDYEISCTRGTVTETKSLTIKVDTISIKEK